MAAVYFFLNFFMFCLWSLRELRINLIIISFVEPMEHDSSENLLESNQFQEYRRNPKKKQPGNKKLQTYVRPGKKYIKRQDDSIGSVDLDKMVELNQLSDEIGRLIDAGQWHIKSHFNKGKHEEPKLVLQIENSVESLDLDKMLELNQLSDEIGRLIDAGQWHIKSHFNKGKHEEPKLVLQIENSVESLDLDKMVELNQLSDEIGRLIDAGQWHIKSHFNKGK